MSIKDVLKLMKDEEVAYVDIRFTDPRGKLQHVTVIADEVDEDFLEEGFMFDGSSIAGWKSIEASDMKLVFDLDSVYMNAVQALTGEGRLSGIVLLALPPALFVTMYQLNSDYINLLFEYPLGNKMLAAAVVLQVVGALVIKKFINIKV